MAAVQFGHISVPIFVPTYLFLVFCLSYTLCPAGSVKTISKNPTIKSFNKTHSADNSSQITWGDTPKTKYIDLSNEQKSDGLEPLFKFSRSFMYSTLNDKLPVDLIKKAMNGKIDLVTDLKKLIMDHIGFLVAIGVGILFVVIFPIIGFCFCLCRCCGNCGGKMIQTQKERSPCRRKVLSSLLFVGIAFSATGTAFMFASDARLMDSIKKTPDVLPRVMKAISTYGDNVYQEVAFMGDETVIFLLDVIKRDLNSLDLLVGIPLKETLDKNAKIGNIFMSAKNLQKDLNKLEKSMTKVETVVSSVKKDASSIKTNMNTAKTSIDNNLRSCQPSGTPQCPASLPIKNLDLKFDPNQLPDIKNQINNIKKIDIDAKIKGPEKEFNDIPELVKNKSDSIVRGVKQKLSDVQKMIPKYLKQAKKLKTDLDHGKIGKTDLGIITNKSSEIFRDVEPYNNFRRYAFLGLAGFCLFIVGLMFFGLLLGVCGHDDLVSPVHRGCASNCGGCMIMGAVVIIFLFGWLLMLLTTLMFIPGAVSEVYGCKTLREIGQGSVDHILKDVLNQSLGEMLFQNRSYDMKISHMYNGCERGQGLYKAAYLNYIVNLEKIFNYPQEKNVKKDITTINVDLSKIKILTPQIDKQLQNSQSNTNIDFDEFKKHLKKIEPGSILSTLVVELDKLGSASTSHSSNFQKNAQEVRKIQNSLNQLVKVKSDLQPILDNMESEIKLIKENIKKLTNAMKNAENVLKTKGNIIVKDTLDDFADRILHIWGSFVRYITDLLDNKIGKCRPIIKIYDYVVIDLVCGMVDSLNAFWFGLGWYLFFLLFNLIVGVKLAKYFRRMQYSDELDGSTDVILPTTEVVNKAKNGIFPHNKVSQMPRY